MTSRRPMNASRESDRPLDNRTRRQAAGGSAPTAPSRLTGAASERASEIITTCATCEFFPRCLEHTTLHAVDCVAPDNPIYQSLST